MIIVIKAGGRFVNVTSHLHHGGLLPEEVWIFGVPKNEQDRELLECMSLQTLNAMKDQMKIHYINEHSPSLSDLHTPSGGPPSLPPPVSPPAPPASVPQVFPLDSHNLYADHTKPVNP